ncbi:sigma 54-interacting transcriptional regulator [Pseudodonghicola flavimaris]|uniref:Sigma 54-interacting transcriptional regulator n=1 Tax=Pseudodonghicola flavimaris TaxID=3050036 RepID=A0ABT7EW88_9RHOB|nr:sigma 54-interacting transcriptional regulator [Pseudodonghicola flavimaris]MDK3016559.1 sigma 54-interacting transcriptional regulator [Pseudodonghicola flavimaris]
MLDHPAIFDSLLHALPEAALVLDLSSDRIACLNQRAADWLAVTPSDPPAFSQLLGAALADFIVFVDEVDHRGEGWTRSVAIRDSQGQALNCELRGRLIHGAPGHMLLMLLDLGELHRRTQITEEEELHRAGVTEWKRAERFFADLERQNQLILNAAGEGIYGLNAEGKMTFVNRAAQEMLGWTAEDLLGCDMHAMIHHHHLDGCIYRSQDCPIYRSFRFEQVHRIEDEVFWRKDGKPIRVEYVSTPIYDQQVLAGAVVIFRDITERKENERRLHDALEEVAALRDRLEQENAYLQEAISSERAHHDIIGVSPAIHRIQTQIDLVARTEATVLITGETGSGKALVASAIHKASSRSRRPLIHFKCNSVAPEAVEAELFGQIRGAYPGAVRDKPGKLELAHGGTLFLEDVVELPIDIQGRLLHALQAAEVTRLGDTRAKRLDIRVIASMAPPPDKALKSGRLREDLLLFLNLFPIACPPLRDRVEDVPLLAAHLLKIACARLNRPVPVITEGTIRRMKDYDWPGNVRELHNVIERAAIVSKGRKLILESANAKPGAAPQSQAVRTDAEMKRMIRDNIIASMRETGGRVAGANGAAALLGVRPTTLYSRLSALAIEEHEWR